MKIIKLVLGIFIGLSVSIAVAGTTISATEKLTDQTGRYGYGYNMLDVREYSDSLVKSTIFKEDWVKDLEGTGTKINSVDAVLNKSSSYTELATQTVDMTSVGVTASGGYGGFSASLDAQYSKVKSRSESKHSSSLHTFYRSGVGLYNYRQTSLENPVDLLQQSVLNETFLDKINEINILAKSIDKSSTTILYGDVIKLNELLFKFIDYYGTHIITAIEKGAYFEHVFSMFFSGGTLAEDEVSNVETELTAAYGGFVSGGTTVGLENKFSQVAKNYAFSQESTLKFVGGDPLSVPIGTIGDLSQLVPLVTAWQKTIADNYVTINSTGKRIYEYIPNEYSAAKEMITSYIDRHLFGDASIESILSGRYSDIKDGDGGSKVPKLNFDYSAVLPDRSEISSSNFTENQTIELLLSSYFDHVSDLKRLGVQAVYIKIVVNVGSGTTQKGYRHGFLFMNKNEMNEAKAYSYMSFVDADDFKAESLHKRTIETSIPISLIETNSLYLKLKSTGSGGNVWGSKGSTYTIRFVRN